ncbi:c-type cytochrome [Aliifodinibius sp. S!AR15-10]|uniref:cbb3-type cytochrome c oxidase N-terminal domain-containing protein n=1 Tax=Aliifodinibius sp. S!AR15-10 TaxID=2950437 RepID=UPI00285FB139|nr:cbb3-type cytochrome c oxidase N-terminal domain-containing protein [Aliifodinibius sp. S!AR15-10]MDR8393424.1 c-type cytochrome [Aliifodinibius sp. S!AR15-10]
MKLFDDEKDKLLDHEYDGIRELDNHMPVWWLWLFYFTIAFSVGYLLYYQVLGWGPTQHEEYQQEVAAAEARYGAPEEEGDPVKEFTWTVSTEESDIAAGKELFMNPGQLCFTCHGNQGQGLVGPNLTDEQWLHGCSPKEVAASIINGYPDMGMLPYGSATKISNEQVQQLVSYIASIQGTEPADAKPADMSRAQPCQEGPLSSGS